MDFVKLWGILCLIAIVAYDIYKTVSGVLWWREQKKEINKLIKELAEATLESALGQEEDE